MDFMAMKRRNLQALCKDHGLKAGGSNADLAAHLAATLSISGGKEEDAVGVVVGKRCLKRSSGGASGGDSDAAKRISFVWEEEEEEQAEVGGRRLRSQVLLSPVVAKTRGRRRAEDALSLAQGSGGERRRTRSQVGGDSAVESDAGQAAADAVKRRYRRNAANLGAGDVVERVAGAVGRKTSAKAEQQEVDAGEAVGRKHQLKRKTRENDADDVDASVQVRVSLRSTRASALQSEPAVAPSPVVHNKRGRKKARDLKEENRVKEQPTEIQHVGITLRSGLVVVTPPSPAVSKNKRSRSKVPEGETAVEKVAEVEISGRTTRSSSVVADVTSPIVVANKRRKKENVHSDEGPLTVPDVTNYAPVTMVLRNRAIQTVGSTDLKVARPTMLNAAKDGVEDGVAKRDGHVGSKKRKMMNGKATVATNGGEIPFSGSNGKASAMDMHVEVPGPVRRSMRKSVVPSFLEHKTKGMHGDVEIKETVTKPVGRSTRRSVAPVILEKECKGLTKPVGRSTRRSVAPVIIDKESKGLTKEMIPQAHVKRPTKKSVVPAMTEKGRKSIVTDMILEARAGRSTRKPALAIVNSKKNDHCEAASSEKSSSAKSEELEKQRTVKQPVRRLTRKSFVPAVLEKDRKVVPAEMNPDAQVNNENGDHTKMKCAKGEHLEKQLVVKEPSRRSTHKSVAPLVIEKEIKGLQEESKSEVPVSTSVRKPAGPNAVDKESKNHREIVPHLTEKEIKGSQEESKSDVPVRTSVRKPAGPNAVDKESKDHTEIVRREESSVRTRSAQTRLQHSVQNDASLRQTRHRSSKLAISPLQSKPTASKGRPAKKTPHEKSHVDETAEHVSGVSGALFCISQSTAIVDEVNSDSSQLESVDASVNHIASSNTEGLQQDNIEECNRHNARVTEGIHASVMSEDAQVAVPESGKMLQPDVETLALPDEQLKHKLEGDALEGQSFSRGEDESPKESTSCEDQSSLEPGICQTVSRRYTDVVSVKDHKDECNQRSEDQLTSGILASDMSEPARAESKNSTTTKQLLQMVDEMNGWGPKSVVEEIPHRNNFKRRNGFTTYVSPNHPSDSYPNDKFVQRSVSIPPMVIRVIDSILLRAIPHKGIRNLEINGNFPSEKEVKLGESQKRKEGKLKKKKKKHQGSSDLPEAEAEVPDPKLWISVTYKGEKIKLTNPERGSPASRHDAKVPADQRVESYGKLEDLWAMLNNFPMSRYEIEINDAASILRLTKILNRSDGRFVELELKDPFLPGEPYYDWTKVTFYPDLSVYNLKPSDNLDIKHIIWKRAIDIAATLEGHIKVYFDKQLIKQPHSFNHYAMRYEEAAPCEFNPEAFGKRLTVEVDKSTAKSHHWQIALSMSNGEFQQISFVNGLPTVRGGTHVELVKQAIMQIGNNLVQSLQGPMQDEEESFSIEDVRVFISLVMENPTFDSDAKDHLVHEFEGEITLNTEIISESFRMYFRRKRIIKPTPNVGFLMDAKEAGGKHANKCYLILTEGLSAKEFADSGLSGMSTDDRRYYGILPLQGKMLNIAIADAKSILESENLDNIMQCLGLVKGVCYKNLDTLRYGHLILMTDQDTDGMHIKGLVINFLNHYCPSLIQKEDFLYQFVTPIIKVTSGEVKREFFSIPEYNEWASTTENSADWKVNYVKGLAAHDAYEAREYFKKISDYMCAFQYSGLQDLNAIELVFSDQAGRQYDRKYWVARYNGGNFLDIQAKKVTYSDFLNKGMILYSIEDISRSIPSIVDGLKPSQRKLLFSAFKKNLVERMKVYALACSACDGSAYRHGHDSMVDTVIRMAQKFVGSNNVNLFSSYGQYGDRKKGGKKTVNARYLDASLSPLARIIFSKLDDPLLNYLIEDGLSVQPLWFLPIIPMVLVNGCEGIATGWSTKLPMYDPRKIIANVKCILSGKVITPLIPWFRGFKGTVRKSLKHQLSSYLVTGVVECVGPLKYEITEIPPPLSIKKYKSSLQEYVEKNKINSFEEEDSGADVKFTVTFTPEQYAIADKEGLEKFLKLNRELSMDNINLIDSKGSLRKYSSADEIVEVFCKFRLPFYQKRKDMMLQQYAYDIKKHKNIARYVRERNNGELIPKRNIAEFIPQLDSLKYDRLPNDGDFNYIRKLTRDDYDMKRVDELAKNCALIEEQMAKLKDQSPTDLWMEDLEVLEKKLDILYEEKRRVVTKKKSK